MNPKPGDRYTLEQALSLAQNLKYGPLPNPEDPIPEPEEALAIISEERRTCGFNWITGETAVGDRDVAGRRRVGRGRVGRG